MWGKKSHRRPARGSRVKWNSKEEALKQVRQRTSVIKFQGRVDVPGNLQDFLQPGKAVVTKCPMRFNDYPEHSSYPYPVLSPADGNLLGPAPFTHCTLLLCAGSIRCMEERRSSEQHQKHVSIVRYIFITPTGGVCIVLDLDVLVGL